MLTARSLCCRPAAQHGGNQVGYGGDNARHRAAHCCWQAPRWVCICPLCQCLLLQWWAHAWHDILRVLPAHPCCGCANLVDNHCIINHGQACICFKYIALRCALCPYQKSAQRRRSGSRAACAASSDLARVGSSLLRGRLDMLLIRWGFSGTPTKGGWRTVVAALNSPSRRR